MVPSIFREDLDWGSAIISHALVFVGFGVIGVGAVLPWADKALPVKVYVLGMQTGLERVWVRRLLVVTGVGLLVEVVRLVTSARRPVLDLVLGAIGALIAVITVLTSPLTGPWMPARGVYVTLFGSLLVMFGSSLSIISPQLNRVAGVLQSVQN